MKAVQAVARGDAREVLRVVDLEPPGPPAAGEVLVHVEYAPLNRHDLLAIGGYLPVPPPPWVPGNEGTGIVAAVGDGVGEVSAGDRVALPLMSGTWREQLVVPAEGMFPLPDANAQQLAMIGSNPPTAVLALDEFVEVPPGSFVVQDAANSGVGRSMIALAHARGLRTVNFARNEATYAELTAAGADLVLPDRPESVAVAREFIGDAPVRVAIDALGGRSTENLTALLTGGGALIAYSAESGSPLSVPYFDLTGKQLTVRGFFAGGWDYATKTAPAIREAAPLIAAGKLSVPVAGVYSLDEIGAALEHLNRGVGKILLAVNPIG
ncbi:zinc-dependent alcohol dehydrogenase family protein [Streptomyces liangshanensis]|uniref:Zinc-dependent alcohol dehydrogenase family protein n=1 Tax=Streptomyces liangshanensis TaxID=2717324 RepID=A0A6G9GST8_9ACTN|nr:zinc-dependent alcohol dehydrogenase family protein [Streptomyces liangshanensis]QIQ01264.1 zinc-dependent alcohol dehydrogenase family protein [Streptomyces liangshanensis]QIQ04140.1 zinc-dependent alcohol dehydrogenase family protein [Streptomyces liangshanensis]